MIILRHMSWGKLCKFCHRSCHRIPAGSHSCLFPTLWFGTVHFAIVVEGLYLGIYILREGPCAATKWSQMCSASGE